MWLPCSNYKTLLFKLTEADTFYQFFIYFKLTQYDVVVILYWGDAFLCGNCLPQVDEPIKQLPQRNATPQ